MWIDRTIRAGAALFIAALWLSAVFDPSIRVLHVLQSFVYIAVIWLTPRRNVWALGAGCLIAILWNYTNIFITNFVRGGLAQLGHLVTTGRLQRPDLLVAVLAASAHFLLIGACLAAFLKQRPSWQGWVKFGLGGLIAVAYFVGIILTTGPQYIPLLRKIFHTS
jgi:hypothetical protein